MSVWNLNWRKALRHLNAVHGSCVLFFIFLSATAQAQVTPSREFQTKAAFLKNFTEFVVWPSDAFENADSPIVIGILGDDPFGSYLDETVNNEFRDGHPLIVERYPSEKDLRHCHVLFISVNTKPNVTHALEAIKTKPVLTVSDMDDFVKLGGMIRFHNQQGKLKLEINAQRAAESNLAISSKLLRLAEVTTGEKD